MNFLPPSICSSISNIIWIPEVSILLIEGLLIILLIGLFVFILKTAKELALKIILTIMSVALFLFVSVVCLIGWAFYTESFYRPIVSDYFVLNAAIKNTCYLDPERKNCPHTVDELIRIEPERFRALAEGKKITYQYYPDTHQYTLIVRDKRQAAIFDPRLQTIAQYGVDFTNSPAYYCGNRYQVGNPPPFPGPWNNI